MKIVQSANAAVINQSLITFTPDQLISLGIKHHGSVSVETPNGTIKTTWEFGPIRFGKKRVAIAKALDLKFGDKLIAEFQDSGHIKLIPVPNLPDPAAMKAYDTPAKSDTRLNVWKDIANSLTVNPREALVLYLPGINDLDREVALKMGFKPDNLIAVERDDSVFAELRHGKKILAIHADLSATLNAWAATPVHAVYADFSCGWGGGSRSLLHPLVTNSAFNDCVVAVNLLRGRDEVQTEGRKNRGLIVWDSMGKTLLDELKHHVNREYALSLATAALKRNRVTYQTSYRSNHQTFDTAVWRNLTVPALLEDVEDSSFTIRNKRNPLPEINFKLRQDIAAILATRTRNLRLKHKRS